MQPGRARKRLLERSDTFAELRGGVVRCHAALDVEQYASVVILIDLRRQDVGDAVLMSIRKELEVEIYWLRHRDGCTLLGLVHAGGTMIIRARR
jgi:hypothetical protein